VAALQAAGTPVAPGTTIIDPVSGAVLGVVDGGGDLFGLSSMLLQTAIPFVLPSSGSIGNNGALTLTTALDGIKAHTFMRFPAGAIFAGSAAGWYYTAMSSTTVGIIYQETYTIGKPVVPASPTPWVTTGPGAYTQTIATDIAAQRVTVPGLAMGVNGCLRVHGLSMNNSSGGSKLNRLRFDGSSLRAGSVTTVVGMGWMSHVINGGVFNRQNIVNGNNGDFSGFGQFVYATIDTSVDKVMDVSLNIAAATDWASSERFLVELIPQG
jgi:hypothetical protein